MTPEVSSPIDLTEPINTGRRPRSTKSATTERGRAEPDVIEEDSDRDHSVPRWRLHRESSWVSLRHERHRASSPNGKPQSPDRQSVSTSPSPLPPPKTNTGWGVALDEIRTTPPSSGSSNPLKATLNNLKRFSTLPRTPSQLSLRSKSASVDHSSRTPSPSFTSTPKIPAQRRVVNAWPDAMTYNDVLALRTTRERSSAYARKIKEFAMYESGLRDWISAVHAKRGRSYAIN